ncbi:MAG TPA: hypothetical protein VN088_21095 [Nocardioides sp.]|nr:hypothetical protein [Nocardioides sp.]
MTRHHRALVAVLAIAGSVLSACGSSPAPVSTPTPTVATTSASPKPTATATPLSPFEDRAPVEALRTWGAAAGRAVDRHDTRLVALRSVTTPAGHGVSLQLFHTDLTRGYRWPGPQPFTPTKVDVHGDVASVVGCFMTSGWSVRPSTHQRIGKRTVDSFRVGLRRSGGRWLFDSVAPEPGTCKKVVVREVLW